MAQTFRETMEAGYALTEPALHLGAPLEGAEALTGVKVQVAFSMLNRHGLVAGATGTGKTKTLQGIAGQLSRAGVPTFIADVKGDLTGMALPGDGTNPKVLERAAQIGIEFEPYGHPVELLSLSGKLGAQVRATVSSFGPLLLARILDLNATQTSVLSLVFKYCDDHDLPLLDLADLRTTLKFLGSDEGKAVLEDYGGIGPATLGVILRSLVTLEQQGADAFFGEPAFEVEDLLRTGPDGQGVVHLLEICGRHGPPEALLDLHAVDAGPALPGAPRGRRPPEAEARLLLRRGPPPLRRRQRRRSSTRSSRPSASSARRASASSSSPRRPRTSRRRSSPSWATASSTPSASSPRRTPTA